MPAKFPDSTMSEISWFALYLFTNHPPVFTKSASVPKFNAIIFSYVYKFLVTAFAVYVVSFFVSVFIIFTIESAVNRLDAFSSIDTTLFFNCIV